MADVNLEKVLDLHAILLARGVDRTRARAAVLARVDRLETSTMEVLVAEVDQEGIDAMYREQDARREREIEARKQARELAFR